MSVSKEAVYGFPCVENPHDFEPDLESCTPQEVLYWTEAKERWDRGERDVRGQRCASTFNAEGELSAHITATSWGIGVNYVEMEDDDSGAGPCAAGEPQQ